MNRPPSRPGAVVLRDVSEGAVPGERGKSPDDANGLPYALLFAPAPIAPGALRVHPGYLRQICLKLQHDGVDADPVLAAGGLSRADVFRSEPIPLDVVLRVLRAVRRADARPTLALELGLEAQMPVLGAIGVAAMNAPTVTDGLLVVARFGGQVNPAVRERLTATPDGALRVHIEAACDLGDLAPFMLQRRLSTVMLILRSISARPLIGVSLRVPDGDVAWRAAWEPLGVRVDLAGGQGPHLIEMPSWIARAPCAGDSPELFDVAWRACEAAERGELPTLAMPDRSPPSSPPTP